MAMSIIMRCTTRATALTCRNAIMGTRHGSFALKHSFTTGTRAQQGTVPQRGTKVPYPYRDSCKWTFLDGKIDGKGVRTKETGTYEGYLRDGKMHGPGRIVTLEGYVFDGKFANDLILSGKGITKTDHGSIYEGEWANGRRTGAGKVTYSNGQTLQGEFQKGRIHTGKGTVIYRNGAMLQAEWLDGTTVGEAHYTFRDGATYTGGWAGNGMHGYGTFAGTKYTYVGHYEHGAKCGEGKITYADGRTLEGTFKDNKIYNGVGVVLRSNGTIESGTWVNGELHGDSQLHTSQALL